MDIRAFKTPQDCSLKNVYLPRHASEVFSCNMCKLALVVHEDLRNSSSCEGKADGPSNHQVSMWAFLQCRFCSSGMLLEECIFVKLVEVVVSACSRNQSQTFDCNTQGSRSH